MSKPVIAAVLYGTSLAALGIMVNSAGWLLYLTALFWILVFVVHLCATHGGLKAYPYSVRPLLVSSVGFLIFSLARYDGGDVGGYTGLSCLLARLGIIDTAYVTGWESLQWLYLWLFVQLSLDLRIIGKANTISRMDH